MATQYILVLASLWLGFLLAISFMESWLKFKAEGVTTKIGLGIGKLVFTALNRMELLFAVLIFIVIFINQYFNDLVIHAPYYLLSVILLIQTFYYLPQLHKRVYLIVNDQTVERSASHTIYVLLELIKAVLLVFYIYRLI